MCRIYPNGSLKILFSLLAIPNLHKADRPVYVEL
jgi:hypothetical protein